ncbi:hypothetical protein H6P81_014915 [Aristolochia fimbriata]|uniref:Uncharacterized protein n=1 Tax=Aristolochia fimbriata TaxID=158543 RepID=A0AAV7E609_ARIFI|nr:hypothetical protein H6P81_014915 [Aristolochia fimbriata]
MTACRIPVEVMHSVHTTLLYSLEELEDVVNWEKILKLQSSDGSFLSSSSFTAFAYMKTGDMKCLDYLAFIVNRFGNHESRTRSAHELLEPKTGFAHELLEPKTGFAHESAESAETGDCSSFSTRNFNSTRLLAKDSTSESYDNYPWFLNSHLKEEGVSWGKDNPIPDIDDSSMTLRLLRLHGYAITPDVLNNFKDKDGNFFCFAGQTHLGVSDMFNMYRLSQVRFPGETILIEAQTFAEGYLRSCMKLKHFDDKWSVKKAFHKEVGYSLNNPWKKSLQRLEGRTYKTMVKMMLYNINNSKYLEMAKLDYNWLLTIYHRERQDLHRWRKSLGFSDPFFERPTVEEIHSSIAATMHEPEFAECRIAYTKCTYIENIIQDLYMIHESVEDLRVFSQAVAKWTPTSANHLPERLKAAFSLMYKTFNEVATLVAMAQARDMIPYLLNLRVRQVEAYLRQREERDKKQGKAIPYERLKQGKTVLHEHLSISDVEAGIDMRVLPAMFLLGENLPDNLLDKLDFRSEIYDKLSSFIKLLPNATEDVTNKHNGPTSAIFRNYTEDRKSSEQEVQDQRTKILDNAFDELTQEYLKPSQVPYCCLRFMFEHARITWFFHTNNPSTIHSPVGGARK